MRIRIHPSFVVYLLCIALLSSYSACLSVLLTLFVHEFCHYAACRILNECIDHVEITPFGGVMTYKPGTIAHKGLKGILVHSAGPLGNYLFLFCISLPAFQRFIPPTLLRSLFVSNASMLLLNLLPALPLDGGHIAFCIGYYFLPIAKLVRLLSVLGIVFGGSGMLLALYGLFLHQVLNCSLLIVSIHLIILAKASYGVLLVENICAVIHERLSDSSKTVRIEHYRTAPDAVLFELISFIKEDVGISFFFTADGQTYELPEAVFCQALLTSPSMTVRDAFLSFKKEKKNLENARFPS